VVITTAGAAKFKKAEIDDPADYFKGKTIRVQGVVTLKEGWPYIEWTIRPRSRSSSYQVVDAGQECPVKLY
jgi:hypothetical protein